VNVEFMSDSFLPLFTAYSFWSLDFQLLLLYDILIKFQLKRKNPPRKLGGLI